MKAQRTTTPTTSIRMSAVTALAWLFDAVTLVFGLVLTVGGLAVISTPAPEDDLGVALACVAIPSGLVLLTALVGGQVWRHGVTAAAVITFRVLLVVAAGLALLGIWANVPTPVPSWRQDVMAWQALGVLTLLLGLVELPSLLGLLTARTGWRRELIGLQVLTAWLPFSWLLLFYPYAPVWAGSRDGLHQVLPELLCLAVVATTCLLQILIRWHWLSLAARDAAALPTAADVEALPPLIPVRVWLLEKGDKPVGVNLGRLPEIYGDWITHDLPAALWSIPAGVLVRVSYLARARNHYLVEGSITGFRDGGVVVDDWWIGGDDIDLTGLVILDDRRSPLSCAHTRTPLLLAAGQSGQPTPEAPVSTVTAGSASVAATSQASAEATPQASTEASTEASARTDRGQVARPVPGLLPSLAGQDLRTREAMIRDASSDLDRTVSIKDSELDGNLTDRNSTND